MAEYFNKKLIFFFARAEFAPTIEIENDAFAATTAAAGNTQGIMCRLALNDVII